MKSEKWYASMHARKGKGENQYTKAKKLGLPTPQNGNSGKPGNRLGKTHSEETKKLLSDIRKEYLKNNPDKVPYLLNHHSKGESYAESYWRIILESNNIEFTSEYRIGIYSLDFAIADKKIDLEIDGDQHYIDERIIESDKRRTLYLQENGWKVIRIRWSEYQKLADKKSYVDNLLQQII